MATFTESSTTQACVVDRLTKPDLGWKFIAGDALARGETEVLVEEDVIWALNQLNPLIAKQPERIDEVLPRLRALVLAAYNDGLVAANERMVSWLRGLEAHQFIGELVAEPVTLIDFDNPRANRLVASTEVTYKVGSQKPRRYDIVLWVNGFPLVVGETKTPVKDGVSWLNAALDVSETYEVKTPGFFVPNVLSFATEGKDFRYGPIGLPPEMWLPWGSTDDELMMPSLARMTRNVELLLTPELVLDILRSYTLYSTLAIGDLTRTIKVVPRYQQVEAVEAVVRRALDPHRKKGLLHHHQGSGKTLLMAFAAGKLRRQLEAPTVVVVLDRLELNEQVAREFTSAGVAQVTLADSERQLQKYLKEDQRGVVITTIYRFKDAGLLNTCDNIVVFCDEAHRTQEGTLGMDMRRALPNATYIGLTGTPISKSDRDTFENFGDPDDPGQVLNAYSAERSIADGATLQIHAETRLVNYHIDKVALDEAFNAMAEEEGLSEEQKETVARKATRTATLMKNKKRIEAVCADIVEHYLERIAPLGLKAQVVCYDRELCVLYQKKIQRLLDKHGEGWESTVVMTCAKGDPDEWTRYDRDRAEEARIKARFQAMHEPLKVLIVTAKLLTGFDAPIEGIMYLDKPLREHNLFQALARTNRRYTNPDTGQEKTAGLVVDYVGLAEEIAKALQAQRPRDREQTPEEDLQRLRDEFAAMIAEALARFDGIDREKADFLTLQDAQQRLLEEDARDAFAREFLTAHALFEFLWPDEALRDWQNDYRWVAKVYQSIQPAVSPDALLWMRVGAKTHALIAEHITEVEIDRGQSGRLVLDEQTIEALRKLGLVMPGDGPSAAPTADEVLDSIEERLKKKLEGSPSNPSYRSLAERLEALKQTKIEAAEDSIRFLKQLLEVARALVEAERKEVAESGAAAAVEGEDPQEPRSLLPDQRRGALTQIFEEYKPQVTPEIIERVVAEIDAVVMSVRFTGWQTSREGDRKVKVAIRQALKKFGIDPTGEIFERAYAYVAEHY
jgi:type I restriction enzyme, R subunit